MLIDNGKKNNKEVIILLLKLTHMLLVLFHKWHIILVTKIIVVQIGKYLNFNFFIS
jgi:hypothetical protein